MPIAADPRQGGEQLFELNRLNDVCIEPRRVDALKIALHGKTRHGDGAKGSDQLAKGSQKVTAVAVRQVDIQQRGFGAGRAGNVNRLTDALGGEDGVSPHPEQPRQQVHGVPVVIHHEKGASVWVFPVHAELPIWPQPNTCTVRPLQWFANQEKS